MRRVRGASLGALVGCAALGVPAGCGGDDARQDAGERRGSYEVRVMTASFPREQSISAPATLRLAVRNDGQRSVPNLAISLAGLSVRNPAPGLADPQQPVWIIDDQPANAATADGFTWALGPLRPGARRQMTWRLTPAVPGTHTVRWTVAASLTGRSMARTASGRRPTGTFTVRVSTAVPPATVDPESGAVTR